MGPDEIQVLVDATEADLTQRFKHEREMKARLTPLVADAVKRADARTRLELALAYKPHEARRPSSGDLGL